jgi:CcmD family protein
MQLFPIAQALSADDVAAEIARVHRNFEFLSYGLLAAWIIVTVYVLMLVSRERKLKKEIARLKAMLEQREPK